MARLAVLFSVIFLLFTVSHARFIVPEHAAVTPEETVTDLPESDPTTTTAILLPSEKPGSEPAKVVDFKHDDASETDSDVESVPLTMISFHPVNRHFPRLPLVPFRHKHNCRFHKRFRPTNPRFQQKRYISYGDDMILSDDRTRFDPESRGHGPQIPARWARFPDDGADSKEHVDFMKPHHSDHEHEHEHDHHDDHHHHHHHQGDEDDDMILSDDRTRFNPESRSHGPQILARWARFPDDGAKSKEHVDFMKPHHSDHEHEHDHDHHDDHHHHHHHHQGEEDDDMILSDDRTRFDPESRGHGPQIPARWARFLDDGAESKEHVDFMKPHDSDHEHEYDHDHDHDEDHHHHHHHFHHHHRHHHEGEEDERNESEEHEGGFMNRFRKFFINF